jgi:hypothetical protein
MRRSLDHRCRRSPLFHVSIESDFKKIALTPFRLPFCLPFRL